MSPAAVVSTTFTFFSAGICSYVFPVANIAPLAPSVIITVLQPRDKNSEVTVRQSKVGEATEEMGREVRMAASVSLRIRWVMEG